MSDAAVPSRSSSVAVRDELCEPTLGERIAGGGYVVNELWKGTYAV